MTNCLLSLGSNVGDRLANIRAAVALLGKSNRVTAKSGVYETPPWGIETQPRFLNCCAAIETDKSPLELLRGLKEIERELGRAARGKWEEREIDIDILTYGDERITAADLAIPHPLMRERAFVLVPLRDIAPGFKHPESGESIDRLLEHTDRGGIIRITEL
ncbi:MAG: 2-amino-4-hydroxy-6-hydroxymethyldihydropteridine diphosphokinase [Synergistaceae bacterium]|nr:2-amino-4-hydroxy-6-hydroxymethyldihydropteridine diphosphokinase [Synergistaceae bacterium]